MKKQIINIKFIFVLFLFLITNNLIYSQWIPAKGPYGGYVYSFAISGSNLFVGTHDGVYLSTNNGNNWNYSGLINNVVRSLVVNGKNIYAGTSGGFYIWSNNKKKWAQFNDGLTNKDIHALIISGNNIFAGSSGGGVLLSSNNGTKWTRSEEHTSE